MKYFMEKRVTEIEELCCTRHHLRSVRIIVILLQAPVFVGVSSITYLVVDAGHMTSLMILITMIITRRHILV